jgi:hypothetical protein
VGLSERKISVENSLRLLSLDELKYVYKIVGKQESLEGLSREFAISKIQSAIEPRDFFKREEIATLFLDKIDRLIDFTEKLIGGLERSELIKVYEDLAANKWKKESASKSAILERLLNDFPLEEIIKNKLFLRRLKPKYLSIADVKSLETYAIQLKENTTQINDNLGLVSDKTSLVEESIQNLSRRLQSIENVFDSGTAIPPYEYLKALYEESMGIEGRLSPETFEGIIERSKKKIGINEQEFVLKGVELLLVHYLLTNVKLLEWRPPIDDFMRTIKEEFSMLKPIGNQAEIPLIRDRVRKKLGISDEMFDDLLIAASKKDLVRFEMGRPIGEYNVKYLVKDGIKYYYLKIVE